MYDEFFLDEGWIFVDLELVIYDLNAIKLLHVNLIKSVFFKNNKN
jgi:hypothetical protein